MSGPPIQTIHAPSAGAVLGDRCRQLDMPVWRWDGTDRMISEPAGWRDADAWLRSPRVRELLNKAKAGWPERVRPPITEFIPGAWLLPIVDQNDPTSSVMAALALGPEALSGEAFGLTCRAAEMDVSDARRALEPLAHHSRDNVEAFAAMLGWMHEDLLRLDEDTHAITTFSKQLIDTYEQMSLLYRVGELMNDLNDPKGFINLACELLQSTLEFQWVAVRFGSLTSLGRVLANELVLAGDIPCSHTRYDRLAGEIVQRMQPGDRPTVIDRGHHELPAIVDSEIFVNQLICDNQIAGALIAGNKIGPDPEISSSDMQLLSATSDYMSAFLHNSSMYSEQRTTFLGIIKALSASIDAKDQYTRGHSERVAHLASQIALSIGMTDEQAERVRLAGILHDMGKIGVPEAVLLKPGKLSDEEFEAIKRHPTIGYNILKDIEPLQDVLPGVLYHHERWDGGGYPQGLRGSAIPLIGRILAVADAFDAMSSDRAYRPRMARETVLREMRLGAGAQWDHELVKVFLTLDFSSYDAMIDLHAAQSVAA